MSLYDDVVADFPVAKPEIKNNNNDIASWNNSNLKLLQIQVEAAKKRQLLNAQSHAKRTNQTSIAPVIDLSRDKNCKPQLQLKKDDYSVIQPISQSHNAPLNQMPPTAALSTPTSYHQSSNELRFNTITGKIERNDTTQSIYGNSTEEYDPMKPNDYEKILIELKKTVKQTTTTTSRKSDEYSKSNISSRRRSRSRSRRRKHSKSSSSRSSSRSSSSSDNRSRSSRKSKRSSKRHSSSSEDDRRNKRNKNDSRREPEPTKRQSNAFPPPMILLEESKQISETPIDIKKANTPAKTLFGGLMKAEKMMAKMGYKEGEGLGRNKQGMSIALQVEKTGKRSGRIIHEKDVIEPVTPTPPPPPPVLLKPAVTSSPVVGIPSEVMKNMSKVILLRNMVAPGDVDDDLEGETKEECQKYGEVNRCIIYEMKEKGPEEAVRIFVEFKTLPSAIKALTDLNGRFFGGRIVKATFYNLDKFNRLELADEDV